MFEAFKHWRRERILKRSSLDDATWRSILGRYPFTRSLAAEERARLRELVVLFLHEKSIVGAGGFAVRDDMRIGIAAQACMLILNLNLDWYRGWVEVIVYPDEFVAEYEYLDEACVGSISEVFDAIEPYAPRGCVAQAWSVAEVLRCWALTAEPEAGVRDQ